MGLDVSHGCWHGSYIFFNVWRAEVAKCFGIPLALMEGFYDGEIVKLAASSPLDSLSARRLELGLPLAWERLKPEPIHILLNHSDCDGEIAVDDCIPIAIQLESIIDKLPGADSEYRFDMQELARKFAAGLRQASEDGEAVLFY